MALTIGAGGGRASDTDTDDNYALDKPYDLSGEPTAEKMQQLDEMLAFLFKGLTRGRSSITDLQNVFGSGGSGDVVGPSSAVDGDMAVFDGVTGKLIKDGGAIGAINGSPVGGILKQTRVIVTNAQMKALNTTPVEVISAPGSGKIVIPVMCWVHSSIAVGYNTSNSCSLRYNGIAVDIGNAQTLASNSAEDSYKYISIQGVNFNSANTNPANSAVMIRATGDLSLGDAANTFNVVVTWIEVASALF